MEYSPALSATSDMTDEELDIYLATCVPLSNLPTPPPAKEAMPQCTPKGALSQTPSQLLASFTLSGSQDAHATHLANLVPRNLSAHHRPHALVIAGFLDRANLPEEMVAFTACLLGSLSSRFAASWRDAFRTDSSTPHGHVSPDVVVLAALSLAHGWLVDRPRGARQWSVRESGGLFSVQEIEATKRAMLVDMDYGLYRISEDMVQKQLREMQQHPTWTADARTLKASRPRNLSLSLVGTSLWCHGVQTPEPSP